MDSECKTFNFCPRRQSGMLVSIRLSTRWFPGIMSQSFCIIYFKTCICAYWVSIQKWFEFWPLGHIFGSMVGKKWVKSEVSGHKLKRFSFNSFQTLPLWLMGECWEIIRFLAPRWAKNGSNLRFRDINWKGFHSIHFKPCHCAYWMSVQICHHFRPSGPICGLLLSVSQSN